MRGYFKGGKVEKVVSEKQERARAYNRANGQLKGMITMLNHMPSELPYMQDDIRRRFQVASDLLWQVRQLVIDYQEELIEEGK